VGKLRTSLGLREVEVRKEAEMTYEAPCAVLATPPIETHLDLLADVPCMAISVAKISGP
jgi:hypothetical protein